MDAAELLRHMVEVGASDLHCKVGSAPFLRVDGGLLPSEYPPLSSQDTETLASELMPMTKSVTFSETSEADFGYTLPGVGRFRVNVFRQRGLVGMAVRRVRSDVPTIEELRLPPVVRSLAELPRGLVLVTGPAGPGKTTSIAPMLGHLPHPRRTSIISIAAPR